MAITVGQNTWGTVSEADSYFTYKVGASDWFALDTSGSAGGQSKESLLVTAFYWLLDDAEFSLSADLTGSAIKRAQFEASLFLLSYREEYERRGALIASGVKSFKNSDWSETLGSLQKPAQVRGILSALGVVASNGTAQLYGDGYEGIGLEEEDVGVVGFDE